MFQTDKHSQFIIVMAKRAQSSALSLHFASAQFFVSHAHSQRVHSAAAGQLTTALYTCTTELEGSREATALYTIFTL